MMVGFLIGFFIGGMVGVVGMGLVAGGRYDD